MATPDTPIS